MTKQVDRSCVRLAAVLPVLTAMVLVPGCFGGGSRGASTPTGAQVPVAAPTKQVSAYLPGIPPTPGTEVFSSVNLVGQVPGELELQLPAGDVVSVRLADVGVFDCRHDCWTDVDGDLPPLQPGDSLCLLLVGRDQRMVPVKLWVNRDTCS